MRASDIWAALAAIVLVPVAIGGVIALYVMATDYRADYRASADAGGQGEARQSLSERAPSGMNQPPGGLDSAATPGESCVKESPNTASGTLAVGESAMAVDCAGIKRAKVSLTEVDWQTDLSGNPEYLTMHLSLTNEGRGMLPLDQGNYNITDTTGMVIREGEMPARTGEGHSPLAPGTSLEETVPAGIMTDAKDMTLFLAVSPLESQDSYIVFEFTVPDFAQQVREDEREAEKEEADSSLNEALSDLEDDRRNLVSATDEINAAEEDLSGYEEALASIQQGNRVLRSAVNASAGDCFEIETAYSAGPAQSIFETRADLDGFTATEESAEWATGQARGGIEEVQDALSEQQSAVEADEKTSVSSGYGAKDVESAVSEVEQQIEDTREQLDAASTQVAGLSQELDQLSQTAEELVEGAGCQAY